MFLFKKRKREILLLITVIPLAHDHVIEYMEATYLDHCLQTLLIMAKAVIVITRKHTQRTITAVAS